MDPFQTKILEELSYLRGRFDTDIPSIKQSMSDVKSMLENHDDRILAIEKKDEYKRGQTVLLSLIVATIFTSVVNWLFRKF